MAGPALIHTPGEMQAEEGYVYSSPWGTVMEASS